MNDIIMALYLVIGVVVGIFLARYLAKDDPEFDGLSALGVIAVTAMVWGGVVMIAVAYGLGELIIRRRKDCDSEFVDW